MPRGSRKIQCPRGTIFSLVPATSMRGPSFLRKNMKIQSLTLKVLDFKLVLLFWMSCSVIGSVSFSSSILRSFRATKIMQDDQPTNLDLHWQTESVDLPTDIQCVSVDSASLIIYSEIKATEVPFRSWKCYLCSFYFRIDNETGGIQWNTLYKIAHFYTLWHYLCLWLYWKLALHQKAKSGNVNVILWPKVTTSMFWTTFPP